MARIPQDPPRTVVHRLTGRYSRRRFGAMADADADADADAEDTVQDAVLPGPAASRLAVGSRRVLLGSGR